MVTNENLPKTEGEFFELLKLYFPNVYDVKYLMKSCKNLKGGLQVRRIVLLLKMYLIEQIRKQNLYRKSQMNWKFNVLALSTKLVQTRFLRD